MAFVQGGLQLTFQGKLQFENGGAPLEQDNFAFCKVNLLFFSKVELKDEIVEHGKHFELIYHTLYFLTGA